MREIELPSDVTGSVWKVLVSPGQTVDEDEVLVLIESMKMEIPVLACESGIVKAILLKEGDPVAEGDTVAILDVQ